jgi:hypothetical protein
MTNVKEPLVPVLKKKKLGIVSVLFQILKCELERFWFQFSEPVLVQNQFLLTVTETKG